jgi:hypothetical protein
VPADWFRFKQGADVERDCGPLHVALVPAGINVLSVPDTNGGDSIADSHDLPLKRAGDFCHGIAEHSHAPMPGAGKRNFE